MQLPKRGRLLAAGTALSLAVGGIAVAAATSQGESASSADARAKLFPKPMHMIVDARDLPRLLEDMERNPAKYDGLDIGVDTRAIQRSPLLQSGLDAALLEAQR
jgi:hypothetical protein